MSNVNSKIYLLGKLTAYIDGWLVPFAFGTLSVLIGAQMITSIQPVRAYVDEVEGRFIEEPASVIPQSVNHETANLSLFLSPTVARPDIKVILNGRVLARFLTAQLTIAVHEGDSVQFESSGHGLAYISTESDNSSLLVPAPGQTFAVSSDEPVVFLPKVVFTH